MPTMQLPIPAAPAAAAESIPRADTAPAAGATRTLGVAAAATLLVLAVFSAAVTTIAQSSHDLHAGVAGETWTLSGMSLGLAISLLTVGTLADEHGRRRVLVSSSAVLAASSVAGALAPNIQMLVAGRVLQGVAGAGVIAASLGLIGHAFPTGKARTHATAVWGAAVGGGIALGPLVAGALSAADGWRISFWFEALVATVLVPAAARLNESRSERSRPIDVPGAVTLAAAMACLTAGLVQGRNDWSAPVTIALLAGGAVLLAQFARVELSREHPMVDLRLLTQPLFVASAAGALFTGLAVIGLMSFSPAFMQRREQHSPLPRRRGWGRARGGNRLLERWRHRCRVTARWLGPRRGHLGRAVRVRSADRGSRPRPALTDMHGGGSIIRPDRSTPECAAPM
jgi:MFS family permease